MSHLRFGAFSTFADSFVGAAAAAAAAAAGVFTAVTGFETDATDVPGMEDSDDVRDDRLWVLPVGVKGASE